MKDITREELDCCIQRCGADENLQSVLRELDADETQEIARRAIRRFELDEAVETNRKTKAMLASIGESPVWQNPKFLDKLAETFKAAALEKSRQERKHYIDSPGQPATPNTSKMGHPKRGADGRVLRDAKGLVIWETDEQSKKTPPNVMADGRIDLTKSVMGNPVRNADGSVKWTTSK